jgi:hypothetical protein
MELPLKEEQRVFQQRLRPRFASLAGYAALVSALDIGVPIRTPVCVSEGYIHGSARKDGPWLVYDKRYLPENTVEAHLTFALKNEPFDPLALKRILDALPQQVLESYVLSAPSGVATRRAWFFFELFTGKRLNVPDAPNVAAIDALDPKSYFTKAPTMSKRHKVRNNLLGTRRFCPVIRRTLVLQDFVESGLSSQAMDAVGRVSTALVARAASFLLLADSQASFQIEGERPPRSRLERWGRAVMQAGKHPLSVEEIVRLHTILLDGDNRFTRAGLRTEAVFLGERTADGEPIPEFIGARPDDVPDLVEGIIETNRAMREAGVDAVLQAAVTAFGFVYVHPVEDGNGRLHRCLIHHVLAERKFTPPGVLFPVSTAMLEWIDQYKTVLQAHSGPLMQFIEWTPTPRGNVEVLNKTADFYRYFDCTEEAEFLYQCVERTVKSDLPREIEYLRRRDKALSNVMNAVEMPDRKAEDFVMFVRQNGGKLSKRRRNDDFAALTQDEVDRLEAAVQEAFEGYEDMTTS